MASQTASPKRVVIAASTVLDGKGHVLHDTRIVVEGPKIVAIDPNAAPVDYDLRGLTVLPGWIDSHVHISWSFGPDGRNVNSGGTTQEAVYQTAANAWATLMAGCTQARISSGVPVFSPWPMSGSSEVMIRGPGNWPFAMQSRNGASSAEPTLCTVVKPAIS